MADYKDRLTELQKAIQEAKAKDFALPSEVPILLAPRYENLVSEVSAYIDWRDKAFAESLSILKNESSSCSAKDQFGRWREHFTKKGDEALKRFTDFVKNDQAPNLRRLGEDIATQESHFFALLAKVQLAWVQGLMQEYKAVFEQEQRNLRDKWRDERDGGKSTLARAKEISKEILELFKKVSEDLIKANREAQTVFQTLFLAYRVMDTIQGGGEPEPEIEEKFQEIWDAFGVSREEMLRRYLEAYKSNETFVILVTQTRESVRNFLAKTNLTVAREEYDAAYKHCKELTDQCITPGQRDDAQRFLGVAAAAEVKPFLEKFEQEYNKFINDYKEIFVGAVGPKVIDDFIDPSYWERFRADLERNDVQAELRKVYDDAVHCWGIDLSSLKEPQLKALEKVWKIELEKLTRGLHAVAGDTFKDRLDSVFKHEWFSLINKFKGSKGGGES